MESLKHDRSTELLKAWEAGLKENSSNPLVIKKINKKDKNLFYQFSEQYEKLTSLSRRVRRAIQRKWKHSLAGIAIVLALGGSPAFAADFNPTTVPELIQAINDANANMEADNIILDRSTFTLGSVDNSTYGDTGLPVITTEIIIEGNGSTIERSGLTEFRILAVDSTANLTLNETTLSGGFATAGGTYGSDGGGIFVKNGNLTITNSTISGNMAEDTGGGIFNYEGTVTITNSNITGNNANSLGGGGVANIYGTSTITNSTISGNTLYGNSSYGGGIFNIDGTTTITNSTISDNTAYGGGGVYSRLGICNITNSTITRNMASIGGGIFNYDSSMTISKTIVSGNSGDTGREVYDYTTNVINADDYNIFGHSNLTNGQAFSGFTPGGSDINATSSDQNIPLANILDTTLADNGGPTLTHALVTGSPAIDGVLMGCTLDEDQRHFTRPEPGGMYCDIGAFEFQPTGTVTITKDTSPAARMGFEFNSTGFTDLVGCDIQDMFTIDDGDTLTCTVPAGNFTITEQPPVNTPENTLIIDCDTQPAGTTTNVDDTGGELAFSIVNNGDTVDCTFVNIVPTPLFNIVDEPAGANCETGGVRIDEGSDTNNNGMLDAEEIDNTTYVCDGADGEQGPEGEDGANAATVVTPVPPGPNCAEGGNRIDIGVDINGDGELSLEEIVQTFFACNGEQGEQGEQGPQGDDGNGCGAITGEVKTTSALSNFFVTLIPAIVGFAGLFWRRRKN